MSLSSFTDAYKEAMLWSSTDDDGEPLDGMSLSSKAEEEMESECEDFYEEYSDYWDGKISDERAGHDFALSRNGHGAGFFDEGHALPKRDLLQKAARAYGEQNLYVGDDGDVHVM